MQKKSLLTTFSISAISAIIGIVVLLGTVMVVFMINDIEEAEELIEESILSYQTDLQVPFDELSEKFDENQIGYYNQTSSMLDLTKEYLLKSDGLSDKDDMVNSSFIMRQLNLLPESPHEGFFVLNNDGDVIVDETGFLKGNLTDLVDDTGEKVFSYPLESKNISEISFSSSWENMNGLETYYASLKKLNEDYYIGLMTSKDAVMELYKNYHLLKFQSVTDMQSASYTILELEGKLILGNINFTKADIDQLIKDSSVGEVTYLEHETYGNIFYQVYPELNWIVINQNRLLTKIDQFLNEEIDRRNSQLVFIIHLVVVLVVLMIIGFAVLSQRVRKKIERQMDVLTISAKEKNLITEPDIQYQEFKQVVKVFNKLIKAKEYTISSKEKNNEQECNQSYLIKMIKYQLIDSNVLAKKESFDLKQLMYECLESLKLENSVFKAEIICEQDIDMTQNKTLIKGLVQFVVTNLIVNSGYLDKNTITIEIYADDENAHLSFTRNVNKNQKTHEDIIYDLLEEIDEVVMSSIGGSLDYTSYDQADRKLIIHCPLVN